jgi:phosphoglycolate phosphatase-like HAD superfamily hydrolase
MVARADAINARLRGNYPEGYSLDETHAPHVTMLQRFVRAKDFDAVTAAITKVLAAERPEALQLKSMGLLYQMWNGVALTAIVVERTPELMRLQQKVADAVAPFAASGGTEAAFIDTPPGADIVPYVETFVPKSTGANYFPHVTAGVATEAFVKQLKAEPFEAFTFKPAGVAIYQLGNFGTASKKLWQTSVGGGPLNSWNDGPAKRSIITFVEKVTKPGSPDFVPVPERLAVFDNDGTLWSEQPMYFQLFFVFDRVKALAPQHPEWKDKEPFASVLKGDLKSALTGGERAIMELLIATHTGMTTEEFEKIVLDWIGAAKHPKTGRLYTEMVYQPMLEVLAYLRANGFKTFIVSGGGIEFMRPWAERVYGIPPEQVVGSSIKTKFELRDGKPVLVRLPELNFKDDKGGKPVGINEHIGRRPVMAFGNSDGDLQMLQWTAAGPGARFCLYVHHTDADREWVYDRQSPVGRLDKGLDEAKAKGWTVVSMKDDWKTVFASERK